MTTDAINYLEAIVIGYCLASREEMTRVFKAMPGKDWHGLMGNVARAMESGKGVKEAVGKAFAIEPGQTSTMAMVYDALKKAEANAGAEKKKPELTKLIMSMSNEELDQLDKAYEEIKRAKAKATKPMEGSKQVTPASAPTTGNPTSKAGTIPHVHGAMQGAQAGKG